MRKSELESLVLKQEQELNLCRAQIKELRDYNCLLKEIVQSGKNTAKAEKQLAEINHERIQNYKRELNRVKVSKCDYHPIYRLTRFPPETWN